MRYQPTDRPTDSPTNRRTQPVIEVLTEVHLKKSNVVATGAAETKHESTGENYRHMHETMSIRSSIVYPLARSFAHNHIIFISSRRAHDKKKEHGNSRS